MSKYTKEQLARNVEIYLWPNVSFVVMLREFIKTCNESWDIPWLTSLPQYQNSEGTTVDKERTGISRKEGKVTESNEQ